MGLLFSIRGDFCQNVGHFRIFSYPHHSQHVFLLIDGLDQMNPNAPATDLKNQMVGLLQAVSYLKGNAL
jgi:outer membrane cobalamin receptor